MSRSRRRKAENWIDALTPKLRRLGIFYLCFSVAWVVMILAYYFGYKNSFGAHDVDLPSNAGFMAFVLVAVPLLAIWGPFLLTALREAKAHSVYITQRDANAEFDRMRLAMKDMRAKMDEMEELQTQLASEMLPHIGAKLTTKLKSGEVDDRALDAVNGEGESADQDAEDAHFDAPEMASKDEDAPAAEDSAKSQALSKTASEVAQAPAPSPAENGDEIDLMDMALVLNFSDFETKGDWADAVEMVSKNPKYLEFLRLSDKVLEVFEAEGLQVEKLELAPSSGEIWHLFSKGERSDETHSLAGIDDATVLETINARMQSDEAFREQALRFQKSYIEMLESFSEDATDEEFVVLSQTRGGRMFAILGKISGVFG